MSKLIKGLATDWVRCIDPRYYQLDPMQFAIKASRGKFRTARHLEYINDILKQVAEGKITRVMISLPPRHGKSFFVSQFFPAWFLGNYPDKRVILTTYESSFARSWGRKIRNLIVKVGCEPDLFPHPVRLAQDSRAADAWDIEGHAGGMITAGVGAGVTGHGGDLIIIDDPIKNAEEAQSPTIQDKLWDWWDSTLSTRLEPGGAIIIIQTRWSKHDLVGKLIDQDEDNEWVKIVLPAIAEENDLLGRAPGEALWPERWTLKALLKVRAKMRPFWWNSLYQQNPIDKEGTLFKREWFEIVDDYPASCAKARYWDFAGTKGKKSDWSAGSLGGLKDGIFYIIHIDRFQKTLMDKLPRVIQNAEIDGRATPICWEEEGGSSGKDVTEIYAQALMGWTVFPIRSTGPKIIRADPLASQARLGHVKLVRGDWNRAFLDEIETFPFGEHDDQVDSTGGVLNHLTLNSQDVGRITDNPMTKKYGKELPSDPFMRHRDKYR